MHQIEHFKKRVLERYGFVLSNSEINQIVQGIMRSSYELVDKESNRVHVYKISIRGIDVRVVCDVYRKCPVTVMPLKTKKSKPYSKNKKRHFKKLSKQKEQRNTKRS